MHVLMTWTAIAVVSATISARGADSKPNYNLKGVSTVNYLTIAEQLFGEKTICAVDYQSLETSIDFVANQSTKLKFLRFAEYSHEMDERYTKARELRKHSFELGLKGPHSGEAALAEAAADAADLDASRYGGMPHLFLNIVTAGVRTPEVGDVCFAVVNVGVSASLAATTMSATGRSMAFPSVEIWSSTYYLIGPNAGFAERVIHTGETTVKDFANAWAASQAFP
jgi:hypothetical protein